MNNIKDNDTKKNILFLGVFIFFVVVIIVGIYLTFVYSNKIANKTEEILSEQNAKEINSHMISNINASILDLHDQAVAVESAFSVISDPSLDDLCTFLDKLNKETDLYNAMVDDDGYLYTVDGRFLATSSLSFLGSFLVNKENMLTDNETINSKDYVFYVLYVDESISIEGHNICGVLIGISNEQLVSRVRLSSEYSQSYANIIGDDGFYVLKNEYEFDSGKNEYSILKENGVSDEEIEKIKDSLKNKGDYLLEVNFKEHDNYYLYFSNLEDYSNWTIVNHIPSSYIRSSLQEMKSDLNRLTIIVGVSIFAISIIMLSMLLTNIKQLKESRSELAKALDNAEQANRAKTTFLNNMSHDIRTPMNAITGLVNIASKNNDNPVVQDALNKIENSSSYLLSLINDVLDISRIESGKTELVLKPFRLDEIVEETAVIIRDYIKDKDLVFNVLNESTPYFVNADKMRIQEILINILSNAVKYTNEGSVTFKEEVTKDNDNVHVNVCYTVEDTGIGMSEEFQKKLFHEFEQEATDARTKYKGTGLGMAITKKLVDMMHGDIKVDSKKDVGTTIVISLKLELAEEVDVIKEEEVKVEPEELKGRRVLLVEDNEINAEIATFILEDLNMDVVWAKDGIEAVEKFKQSEPGCYDVILMDVMMPNMDGYEATRKIRELVHPMAKIIPIIAMTANAYAEDKQKAYESGMNDYVTKPIDKNLLLKTIVKYLQIKNN